MSYLQILIFALYGTFLIIVVLAAPREAAAISIMIGNLACCVGLVIAGSKR